ncbi:toprim domain-containing protein [Novosphingobium sp. 9]|uniref:toprim domain-containing protein n=1 Tax=Novosphingobium sp. 9 TaxID=2025349 RepID=UPI0021B50E48|nr:toprim domain-containing protein [Novosphingobium sp. 9]
MNLEAEVIKALTAQFQFRKTKGSWMQEGKCPSCGQREAYCSAKEPKIVRCGRQEKCGWEDSVRALLPDLFEDWSKRFPASEENPAAAADAYLSHERGLDLRLLRGTYTQELYRDSKTGHTSATVRFPVGDTYWERIIDKPGRFKAKAHFAFGGKPGGHCWIPPRITLEQLATAEDIWITEGIFNAVALNQGAKLLAVSAMSCNYWPEHFLADLSAELLRLKRTLRPRLVFAFDPGGAGVKWARKFVRRAQAEGWAATAAQVSPDGEGTSKDWNDLLLDHVEYRGEGDTGPLSGPAIEGYLWNGAVTIAATPHEKAKLIYDRKKLSSFDFRHGNRLWWCKVTYNDDEERTLMVDEISTCAFRMLYRERDDILDETNYFLQVDFPDAPTQKARFSNNACANSAEFKKRLLAFAGQWSGTQEQLDRLIRHQIRHLKVVTPVLATGYSEPHRAWILGDIAVREGRLIPLNGERYFDFGKQAVKLYSEERLLDITYDADKLDFEWLGDFWTAFGPKGFVALAFFTMSLFAVQIRARDGSLGFLEVTGMPGSGKTTMMIFLWKLLGRFNHEGYDPNAGSLAFLGRVMMKVANLPVGLIEGKRDDDKPSGRRSYDYNDLLTIYNGRNPRGTARKTNGFETSEPPFLGSIYLMQNERIDAQPAVLERLMSMDVDKSRFSEHAREAATRLKRWPMERLSGTIVHATRLEGKYLPAFFEHFERHQRTMGDRVEGLVNDRCILNHSQLAAAVECLPGLFPDIRPEWIAETLQLVDAMAINRQQSCGGDHPLVAKFWDQVEYLIDREPGTAHAEGKSLNQHRKPDQKIAIRLVEFEARARQAGIVPPDGDALRKVLRNSHSRKFLKYESVNSPSGKHVKCWIFQQPLDAGRVI